MKRHYRSDAERNLWLVMIEDCQDRGACHLDEVRLTRTQTWWHRLFLPLMLAALVACACGIYAVLSEGSPPRSPPPVPATRF